MNKMQTHIKIIAWLHIALGGLITLTCLGMGAFFLIIGKAMQQGGSVAHQANSTIGTLSSFNMTGWIILATGLILGIPGIITGIGLLRLTVWGRVLGIVVSILNIIALNPLHLALGVYGLVILCSKETVPLFQRSL